MPRRSESLDSSSLESSELNYSSSSVSDDEGSREDEEEVVIVQKKTLRERLLQQRQQWLKDRRHPLLEMREQARYHAIMSKVWADEERVKQENLLRSQERVASRERKEKRQKQRHVNREMRLEYQRQILESDEQVRQAVARDKILTEFALEDRVRQQERTNADFVAMQTKMAHEEKDRIQSAIDLENSQNLAKEEALSNIIRDTEEIGRRYGTLPALPRSTSSAIQQATSDGTTLHLSPAFKIPPCTASKPQSMSVSMSPGYQRMLSANLDEWPHVKEIQARDINDSGGCELAHYFKNGCCQKLEVLSLGYARLKSTSIAALSDSFRVDGAGGRLKVLDLRYNYVDIKSLQFILDAISCQKLPVLEKLYLQGNLFGDKGAKQLAHAALAGVLKTLQVIDIRHNQICTAGALALWHAFRPGCISKRYCPNLELLDVRRNEIPAKVVREFIPCPKYISF